MLQSFGCLSTSDHCSKPQPFPSPPRFTDTPDCSFAVPNIRFSLRFEPRLHVTVEDHILAGGGAFFRLSCTGKHSHLKHGSQTDTRQ